MSPGGNREKAGCVNQSVTLVYLCVVRNRSKKPGVSQGLNRKEKEDCPPLGEEECC